MLMASACVPRIPRHIQHIRSSGCAALPSRHRSYRRFTIPPRMPGVLIIYLRDVRRTCRTFAIASVSERVSARARARPSRHSGFRAFFVPLPIVLCSGLDLFGRHLRGRPRCCLLTNRSCNSNRTRIFVAGEKSRRDHARR